MSVDDEQHRAMLWAFRKLEHRWSGHLRDRDDKDESFAAR